MRILLVTTLVLGLLAVPPANSQQPQTNPAGQVPTDAAKPSSDSTPSNVEKSADSTIVFFREGHYAGSALKPSVFLDGKELDRLANGRWFSVHTAPGKHQLQSSAKNESATVIETAAGETTYVQMVVVPGTWRGAGRLLQVEAGDAQKAIAKLKPLHE